MSLTVFFFYFSKTEKNKTFARTTNEHGLKLIIFVINYNLCLYMYVKGRNLQQNKFNKSINNINNMQCWKVTVWNTSDVYLENTSNYLSEPISNVLKLRHLSRQIFSFVYQANQHYLVQIQCMVLLCFLYVCNIHTSYRSSLLEFTGHKLPQHRTNYGHAVKKKKQVK